MANSKNTSRIVSCVLWRMRDGYDMPVVTYCDSRSYRLEEHVMERYYALIDSFKERGYEIEDLDVKDGHNYFGVSIHSQNGTCGVVYIDRNPVYKPY